jgi:hypothetical protein
VCRGGLQPVRASYGPSCGKEALSIENEFPGVRSRVMGVIGNAVALDVAATIGKALRLHANL